VRRIYDKMAPKFDRQIRFWERALFAGGREWICSQAYGEVLEVGVGTGRNFGFYSPEIRVTGIEISPTMLDLARARAKEIGRDIELQIGDGQALEFPDASFDSVIFCLTLCSIPDHRRAVTEAKRVLRPGGHVFVFEHVRSPNALVRGGQRLLEPLSVRFGADHLVREPLETLRAEGFDIEQIDRSKWGSSSGPQHASRSEGDERCPVSWQAFPQWDGCCSLFSPWPCS